ATGFAAGGSALAAAPGTTGFAVVAGTTGFDPGTLAAGDGATDLAAGDSALTAGAGTTGFDAGVLAAGDGATGFAAGDGALVSGACGAGGADGRAERTTGGEMTTAGPGDDGALGRTLGAEPATGGTDFFRTGGRGTDGAGVGTAGDGAAVPDATTGVVGGTGGAGGGAAPPSKVLPNAGAGGRGGGSGAGRGMVEAVVGRVAGKAGVWETRGADGPTSKMLFALAATTGFGSAGRTGCAALGAPGSELFAAGGTGDAPTARGGVGATGLVAAGGMTGLGRPAKGDGALGRGGGTGGAGTEGERLVFGGAVGWSSSSQPASRSSPPAFSVLLSVMGFPSRPYYRGLARKAPWIERSTVPTPCGRTIWGNKFEVHRRERAEPAPEPPMHVTMIKKRLLGGEACRKCGQAEDLLKSRGLWDRIDEVLWADEGDPESPGMKLGARLGAHLAPFFVVREDDGSEILYESVLKLVKERLADAPPPPTVQSPLHPTVDLEAAVSELGERHPSEILKWGLHRFGSSLGIAFSGAEDVVLIHMASELGLPFSVFCLDTGRLHPETYRFVDTVRKQYGIEIQLLSPDAPALQTFVKKKGLFSFYEDGHEECCGIRKIEPLRRVLGTFAAWATGQRRDQSPATRSGVPVVEFDRTFSGTGMSGQLVKLNPLAAWTSAQTWDFIRENRVPFNALHERGYVSIGCEPCTRAIQPGEHERAGRWWWEDTTKRECGLHIGNVKPPPR
ncbi:MAG TPA: phosphoadenylyl-sulfate reductase, partial [Polyangiaceae bacterium]